MSSYLRGGTGRAYGFDLENIVKSSSTTTTSSRTSHSHSSSTLSESSNSPNVISTRKPRTPRKRPNQTYNEAAALLSTACPTIFSITKKSNKQQSELPNNHHTYFLKEPVLELLLPFPGMKRPSSKVTPRDIIEYNGNWNCSSSCNSIELRDEGYQDYGDFDTESILDEEIEEGIDSIMGNSNSIPNEKSCVSLDYYDFNCNTCYGYPIGLGFGGNLEFQFGFGLRNGVRALKNVDEGNWWSFKAVNLINVSSTPASTKLKKTPVEKKKKVEDLMIKLEPKLGNRPVVKEESLSLDKAPRLLLKLNYDSVLSAWSDKGSPLPEEMLGSESPGGDIHARLAQIDLFSENGGGEREASVNRYKEKRQTRLFSKKIRYQVRKVNADRRPRSKGRFVRRPANPPICEET